MDDFKVWFYEKPLVTRTILSLCFITSCIISFGLISPAAINLDFPKIFYSFQLWRLFTHFFFLGTFSFNLLFAFMFMFFAISRLESLYDKKTIADFLFLIAYAIVVLNVIGLIFDLPFLANALEMVMVYIWCKRRPLEIVQFLFGIKVKSQYFPFVLALFHVFTGRNDLIFVDAIGLAVGHSYIFLKDILPITKQKDYLKTPAFFQRFINKHLGQQLGQGILGQQQQQRQQQQQNQFRPFAGQGVRIG